MNLVSAVVIQAGALAIHLIIIGPFLFFSSLFWVYLASYLLSDFILYRSIILPKTIKDLYTRIIFILYPCQINSNYRHISGAVNNDGTIITEKGSDITTEIKGILFIANHQLWELELPLIVAAIYSQTGIWPTLIVDQASSQLEIARIFKARDCALYFPGGDHEALRSKKVKRNTPIWENNSQFCQLANQYGYKIVPIGSIGIEENLIRLFDIPYNWIFRKKCSRYVVIPISIAFPNQRLYVNIGESIHPDIYINEVENSKNQISLPKHLQLRDICKKSLVECINDCIGMRHEDPNRYFFTSMY